MINLEHERAMTCCRCKAPLIVGGFVDDLDPETYVGVSCGCRPVVVLPPSTGTAEAMGRARTAQEARRG